MGECDCHLMQVYCVLQKLVVEQLRKNLIVKQELPDNKLLIQPLLHLESKPPIPQVQHQTHQIQLQQLHAQQVSHSSATPLPGLSGAQVSAEDCQAYQCFVF